MASTWETSAHLIDCTSSSLEPPFPVLRLAHRCNGQPHIPCTLCSRHPQHRSLVRAGQLQWFQLCGHLAYFLEILRKDMVYYRMHYRRGALGSYPIQVGHPVRKFQGSIEKDVRGTSHNIWPTWIVVKSRGILMNHKKAPPLPTAVWMDLALLLPLFTTWVLHGFTVVSSPLQLSGPFLQGHPPKQVATCWTWCAAHIPSFPSSSDMVCLLSNHGKAWRFS